MNKTCLYCLVAAVLLGGCAPAPSGDHLRGKVKAIEESLFDMVWVAGAFAPAEKPRRRSVISYRPDGKESEKSRYGLGEGFELDFLGKTLYEYDGAGIALAERSCRADGSLENAWVFRHDDQGRETMSYYLDENEKLAPALGNGIAIWTYSYDSRGRRAEAAYFGPEGNFLGRTLESHDSRGRLIRSQNHDASDALSNTWSLDHDWRGRRKREIFRDSAGVQLGSTEYSYRGGGKIQEKKSYGRDGELRGKELLRLDRKGNVVEQVMLGGDGAVQSRMVCVYVYDEFGNWIEKTVSWEESSEQGPRLAPRSITTRKILYYP